MSVVSRRSFLRSATALAASPYLMSRRRADAAPPSERIALGFIGLGGRGSGHVQNFLRRGDVQVVAVCDPYAAKRERARQWVDKQYRGSAGAACVATADFRELVTREDVDAVVIASPENWHALHSIWAARHGKDVYCEKALSRTVVEGIEVCRAVRRYGRILQVGTQQRSGRNFRFACELARNGYLGALQRIEVAVPGGRALPNAEPKPPPPDLDYDLWLGPAPWSPYNDLKCSFNWYFIADYCAGWIQSWGVHHMDIAHWGAPELIQGVVEVDGTATFPTDGLANTSITWNVNYRTAGGLLVRFTDNRQLSQGCKFIGQDGWVHVNRSGIRAEPTSLLKVQLKDADQRLPRSDNHGSNFLESIRSRQDPVAPVEGGHAATALTLIGDIATRTGRPLRWDWDAQRFIGDEWANRHLRRTLRSPWRM